MDVKFIPAVDTYGLRQAVLRPHQAVSDMAFDNDDAPDTFHLGAYDGTLLIGIVSLYKKSHAQLSQEYSWQLRGMAALPAYQGKGSGRLLVEAAVQEMKQRGGRGVWCNARVSAVKFYEKLGFKIFGEPFVIAGIGPHVVMRREL